MLIKDRLKRDQTGDVEIVRENERLHIQWALLKTGWKVRAPGGAAELLEIHPSTLAFKMKKLSIQRPEGFSKRRNTIHLISEYQKSI